MQEAAALQGGDINKLKAAHRQEVDGLVKKYNAKYNQLLTDKMAMEDQLTEDHAVAMRELEARLRAEFAAASKYTLVSHHLSMHIALWFFFSFDLTVSS